MGLQEYLAFCVGALERLFDFSVAHIVLSNETCDLDSAVSAISYAYYLHETSTAPVGTALFLPVLNISRADFPLHTEVNHFLAKFAITSKDLIFISELDLARVKARLSLMLTLVDHHVLSKNVAELEENVVQILDHRPQDGDLPDRCDSTMELVGSCCTLVSEALFADETFAMDSITANLLYGAIVTDTINFSLEAGKATQKDLDIAIRLEEVLGGSVDRDSIYREIKEAKFDLTGLTCREILLKDLKMVAGDSLMVAMSSVTMDMNELMKRADFMDSLESIAAEKSVDIVVVLTVCVGPDDSVTRQLGIFSLSRVYRQQMADALSACQSPSLGLSALPCSHEEFMPFYQSNVKASRKQVLPIIKGFLSGEHTPEEGQLDAFDILKDQPEGFTSMSNIVDSRQNTFDGEITSEDLTSRDNSTDAELSPVERLLPGKIFDPLSSVHSSDSAISPSDINRNALAEDSHHQLGASEELVFDAFSDLQRSEKDLKDSWEEMLHGSSENFDGTAADVGSSLVGEGNLEGTVVDSPQKLSGSASAVEGEQQEDLTSLEQFLSATQAPLNNSFSVQYTQDSVPAFSSFTTSPQDNTDQNQPDEFEENIMERDILEMASPHDLLFPSDSPLDVSAAVSGQTSGMASGQTSGHGSKGSSYPVTPPNSYMELDGNIVPKETYLPSFNSSEMVEKIQEKKAALGGSGSEDSDILSPFTPQNSYVETNLSANYTKETQLPSFHSSDMVERIREKRSSMERDLLEAGTGESAELDNLLEAVKSPFTPPNSYMEGGLETYARENLPSLNNAEMASKIKQKQAELAGEVESGSASPGAHLDSPKAPYTPQNSYRDSHLVSFNPDSHQTDLNEVAERLSLTESESSGSLNEPKAVKASNRVHSQGLSPQEATGFSSNETAELADISSSAASSDDRRDSDDLAEVDTKNGGHKKKGVSFSDGQDVRDNDEKAEEAIQKIAFELANEMIQKALESFPSESVRELVTEDGSGKFVNEPIASEDSIPSTDESDRELSPVADFLQKKMETSEQGNLLDSALVSSSESEMFAAEFSQPSEAGIKTSSSLADELAQALDRDVAEEADETSQQRPLQLESDDSQNQSYQMETDYFSEMDPIHRVHSPEEADGMSQQRPLQLESDDSQSRSYQVETEYLSEMDPMHCVHSPEATIIVTDADREVVEGTSFRKISDQEYQEEIQQQLQQETEEREMAKLRQSSVAEESDDDDDVITDTADQGSIEDLSSPKRITAPKMDLDQDDNLVDEEGKRTIHVVRDRELYANALENESMMDVPDEQALQPSDLPQPFIDTTPEDSTTDQDSSVKTMLNISSEHDEQSQSLQPSSFSHPLLHTTSDGSSVKEKLNVSQIEEFNFTDEPQHYESFAETSSLGVADDAKKVQRLQGESSAAKPEVARTVSSTSDTPASQRGTELKGADFQGEWQDDELPNIVGEEARGMAEALAATADESRKKLVPDDGLVGNEDNLENVPVVDSDSEIDSDMDNEQLEWETRKLLDGDDTPVQTPSREVEAIPQYTAAEERKDALSWKMIDIGDGEDFRLDMQVIEPYKKVLSHGGYYGDRLNAMVVFSACYLPSRDRKDYTYVMNHLFHYVIHTLDELVADDYMIVYFHGATPRRQMPSFSWLKRCYQGIDRRLKKNLKALYLVHPTLWLKTVVLMTRPFISAKFSSKLQFVRSLDDLKKLIPMDYVYIPEIVQKYDDRHFNPSASSTSSPFSSL